MSSSDTPNKRRCKYLYVSPRLLCIMLAISFLLGVGLTLLLTPSHADEKDESQPSSTAEVSSEPTEESTEPEPTYIGTAPETSDPLLLLVNREHPIPENYQPELKQLEAWDHSVAKVAYDDLRAMLTAGVEENLSFQVCSAYRTREEQQTLFDEDLQKLLDEGKSREEAYAEVLAYTMPGGCSEHETGLALDIVSTSNQKLDESQESTAETRWLHEHCWEYGFVLRYPEEKSTLTGIAYEAWHYRYVGRAAAKFLTENHLTLEEYWEQFG